MYLTILDDYREREWFEQIASYLRLRYPSITDRFTSCFRYVDLHPKNASVFSYEFSSLLRDIGGIFSSTMENMVKNIGLEKSKRNYVIYDYTAFLFSELADIENVIAVLSRDFSKNEVAPFLGFTDVRNEDIKSVWWNAYNSVKHRDIESREYGNLSNVLYAFCALTFLYDQFFMVSSSRLKLIGANSWFREDPQLPEVSGYIIDNFIFAENVNENNLFPTIR